MRYLNAGQRARGLATYLRELPHQARARRARFLALYPALLLAPARLLPRLRRSA